ncbi:hypothetical protein [Streptomyces chrestomyceticus]|uniref:hypothetical protein n=1 Tax=Streptomyces chrestomyceticus TaxID=68185 RepID=UPI0037A35962
MRDEGFWSARRREAGGAGTAPHRRIRKVDCNENTRPWRWKAAPGTAFTVLADYGAAALDPASDVL